MEKKGVVQEGGRSRRRKNEAKKLKREMNVIFFPKAMAVGAFKSQIRWDVSSSACFFSLSICFKGRKNLASVVNGTFKN